MKPTVRDLHLAHVAALTADELAAADDAVVMDANHHDDRQVQGHYNPWRVSYDTDGIDSAIYDAEDSTHAQVRE